MRPVACRSSSYWRPAPPSPIRVHSSSESSSESEAVQLPHSDAEIKSQSTNAVLENASVQISKTKSTQERVPISKPVNRIDDLQTVTFLLPFSSILPRSNDINEGCRYTSLTGSRILGNKRQINTFHFRSQSNYALDGPTTQLSDPMTRPRTNLASTRVRRASDALRTDALIFYFLNASKTSSFEL